MKSMCSFLQSFSNMLIREINKYNTYLYYTVKYHYIIYKNVYI